MPMLYGMRTLENGTWYVFFFLKGSGGRGTLYV